MRNVVVIGSANDVDTMRAIAPGRTTEALLMCAKEEKWTRHKFVREARVSLAARDVDLIFVCGCGAERPWGREDRR